MISTLLTILKILAMIILVLLGTAVVFLILVLAVPVRYRISVHRRTEEEAPVVADARVTWLLHILNAAFFYPETRFRVRILCFTLFRAPSASKPDTENKKKKPADAACGKGDAEEKPEEKQEVPESRKKTQNIQKSETGTETETETDTVSDMQNVRTEEKEEKEEKRSILDFFKKLFSVLKNIKYTIAQICDKIKHIVNNIQYYIKVIKSDTFRRGWTVCFGEIQILLKKLLPGKITGQLRIGTGDPAGTGQVMAVYGILYPLLGNHIDINPDFDQQVIEGELFIKGKITVFRILKTAGVIYFNRDLRRLIKLLKREAI